MDIRTGREVREAIRSGRHRGTTAGLAPSFVQANLVVLPVDAATEFHEFCRLNPGPCPLLEALPPGQFEAARLAPGSDIRVDLPLYRVYRHGTLDAEIDDLHELWQDGLAAFLIGCSYTFEQALVRGGIPLPHFAEGGNVAMYLTSQPTLPAGRFGGPLVVSMRWVPPQLVEKAIEITSRFPLVHAGPIHVGDPQALGIANLGHPDFGQYWRPPCEDAVPAFWGCGVTPMAAAIASRLPLMITHSPGYMFVTDWRDEALSDVTEIPASVE